MMKDPVARPEGSAKRNERNKTEQEMGRHHKAPMPRTGGGTGHGTEAMNSPKSPDSLKSPENLEPVLAKFDFICESAAAHFARIDYALLYQDDISREAYRDLQDQLAELKIELAKLAPPPCLSFD